MDTAHTDLNIMKAEYNQKNCWVAFGALVVDFNIREYVDNGSTQNLAGRFMKRAISVFIVFTLSACDIAYQPTLVRDDTSANIRVVHLTPETILEANSSPYTPQSWPNAFVSIDELENSEKNDKIEFVIEGIFLYKSKQFDFIGKKVIDGDQEVLSFKTITNDRNYVESTYKTESDESKYFIKIVENGLIVAQSTIKIEEENDNKKIKFELVKI